MDGRKHKTLIVSADIICGKKQKKKQTREIETKALERACLPVGSPNKGSVQKA
jgi:hypothetical protein